MIISYLTTFLGTNSLSVLMFRKAVNQSVCRLMLNNNSPPQIDQVRKISTVHNFNLFLFVEIY